MSRFSNVDYSQGLPTPVGMGFISALLNSPLPAEVVALRPDEVDKVRKWVEGPNALKRAQGLMKSAFHQITEGRPDPAARLVISAAVLAGYGWRENPEVASRIIETARRVVKHALVAKSGAVNGLGDDMLVLSEVDPRIARLNTYKQIYHQSMNKLATAKSKIATGRYGEAMVDAAESRDCARAIRRLDPEGSKALKDMADNLYDEAIRKFNQSRSIAGVLGPIDYFDSKGTMWGSR